MLLKDRVSRPISSRGNRDDGVERATLDRGGAVEQAPHRADQAQGDRRSNGGPEHPGDRQKHQADFDHAPLVGACPDNGGAGEPPHLAPRRVDLAIEIVPPIVQLGEQLADLRLTVGPGSGQQLGEDRLVTSPFLLQRFNPDIEARQRDIVVKVECIGDLVVDVGPSACDQFVAGLAGLRHPLAQVVDLRRVVGLLGCQQQAAHIRRFCDRADVGLRERDIGRKIVLIDDDELIVDDARHPHAQQRHGRH
jgi:hypothetical protein